MLEILMGLVALVLLLIFVTQLLIPFIVGTPFFPVVRKSTVAKEVVKTERELAETKELVQYTTQLEDAKSQLAELNQKKDTK